MSFLGIGSRLHDDFTKEAVIGGLLSKAVSFGAGSASKMLGGASKVLGSIADASSAAPSAVPRAAAPTPAITTPRLPAPSGVAAASPPQPPKSALGPLPRRAPAPPTDDLAQRAAQIQKRLGELDRRAQELSERARPGFHGLG